MLGIYNGTATLENSLVIPQKEEFHSHIYPRIKNIHSFKNLYVNVHNNIEYNSQKGETKCS